MNDIQGAMLFSLRATHTYSHMHTCVYTYIYTLKLHTYIHACINSPRKLCASWNHFTHSTAAGILYTCMCVYVYKCVCIYIHI